MVAGILGRACADLLIGKQADPRLVRRIEAFLERQHEIDDLVDVLTMVVGTTASCCARGSTSSTP